MEVVQPDVKYTKEELEEILAEGAEWEDGNFVPEEEELAAELSDTVDDWDDEEQRWIYDEEETEEDLAALEMHADVSPVDYEATSPSELCE